MLTTLAGTLVVSFTRFDRQHCFDEMDNVVCDVRNYEAYALVWRSRDLILIKVVRC